MISRAAIFLMKTISAISRAKPKTTSPTAHAAFLATGTGEFQPNL
jgi:hypothetical protein